MYYYYIKLESALSIISSGTVWPMYWVYHTSGMKLAIKYYTIIINNNNITL